MERGTSTENFSPFAVVSHKPFIHGAADLSLLCSHSGCFVAGKQLEHYIVCVAQLREQVYSSSAEPLSLSFLVTLGSAPPLVEIGAGTSHEEQKTPITGWQSRCAFKHGRCRPFLTVERLKATSHSSAYVPACYQGLRTPGAGLASPARTTRIRRIGLSCVACCLSRSSVAGAGNGGRQSDVHSPCAVFELPFPSLIAPHL